MHLHATHGNLSREEEITPKYGKEGRLLLPFHHRSYGLQQYYEKDPVVSTFSSYSNSAVHWSCNIPDDIRFFVILSLSFLVSQEERQIYNGLPIRGSESFRSCVSPRLYGICETDGSVL